VTTITVKGYLYAERNRYGNDKEPYRFNVAPWDSMTACGALLGPVEFRYTLPGGTDLGASVVAAEIAMLQAERDKAARDFADTVKRIDEQLAKLLAIGNEVQA
jgi:hypothetical protein